jgi:hypothetical protein
MHTGVGRALTTEPPVENAKLLLHTLTPAPPATLQSPLVAQGLPEVPSKAGLGPEAPVSAAPSWPSAPSPEPSGKPPLASVEGQPVQGP